MLGNCVFKYFKSKNYQVETTEFRWDSDDFKNFILKKNNSYIINCIGAIPQKKYKEEEYIKINYELPKFLESTGAKIIHPSTDCEFSGNIENDKKYHKFHIRDAYDDYGKSKSNISQKIETEFINTKIIRTSIVGHEMYSHVSILDWFLNSNISVNGYTNVYWNGITTLQWSKLCENLINNWDTMPKINQYGTNNITPKIELLKAIKKVYNKNIEIHPKESSHYFNKCLESDLSLPSIEEQLKELKEFYNK